MTLVRVPARYDEAFAKGVLDRLASSVALNADTKYAAQVFRDAKPNLRLIAENTDVDLQGEVLARLLPMLQALPRLPPGLVDEMIKAFGWPVTPQELRDADKLPSGVRELLERHVRQDALGQPLLVRGRWFAFTHRHPVVTAILGALALIGLVTGWVMIKLFIHMMAGPVH